MTPVPPSASPSPADSSPYITLAQFLKKLQLADSGGAAKHLARSGAAQVNGAAENRPGRKLRAGDTVTIKGQRHVVSLERDEDEDGDEDDDQDEKRATPGKGSGKP
jgi:ribosome-associated protein